MFLLSTMLRVAAVILYKESSKPKIKMIQDSAKNDNILDARGLFCPEPVMLLHKKIRELSAGEKVIIRATDPSTARDIPKFCHFLGHKLLESKVQGHEFFFIVLKVETTKES